MKKDIFNNYKVKLIIFLCIVFLCTILAEFLRFTKPLFDRIYYGYLTPMIIDALRIIIIFLSFLFLQITQISISQKLNILKLRICQLKELVFYME